MNEIVLFLRKFIDLENECEILRESLAKSPYFDSIQLFNLFDRNCRSFIDIKDLSSLLGHILSKTKIIIF